MEIEEYIMVHGQLATEELLTSLTPSQRDQHVCKVNVQCEKGKRILGRQRRNYILGSYKRMKVMQRAHLRGIKQREIYKSN